MHCTGLIAHVSQEMSLKCRDSVCPHFSNDFRQAWSGNMKLGKKLLFSNDLLRTVEALKPINNVFSVANASRQGQHSLAHSGYPNSAMFKYPCQVDM